MWKRLSLAWGDFDGLVGIDGVEMGGGIRLFGGVIRGGRLGAAARERERYVSFLFSIQE